MKKTNHKFQRAMASFLAFVMVMLCTSLLTTISVLAADGDITYLAPVYDAEGNITFDGDGNVVMAEQTLTDGTYNVVTTSTTVMGTTDTAAVADANGEYWYVVNENVTMPTAITGITVTGKIHLILCDGAALDMSFDTLTVSEGNELTIYGQENGTGTLKANTNNAGSSTGAGIGGNVNSPNAGKITINGGMVSARGATNSGAGIGGGKGGNGGEITINGGAVTATGGTYYGAGIGGSGGGSGGNITINGGQVVANAGSEAAAIGGSSSGSLHGSSGNIIINGGTVTAMTNSGSYSCGIGTGKAGKLDSVTINGGIITASGSTAAAIGTANYSGTDNGTIAINGGKVTATVTGGSAPAIGNNKTGTVDVTITGGYIEAVGGTASAGIGGGQNANSGQITISGGTVIARAGTCTTGSQFSAAGIGGGGSTSSSKDGGIGYVTITGGYIEAYSSGAYANTGGAGIGGGRMNHGVISIGGGCIIAEGGPDADGIGGGAGRDVNTQFVQVEFTGSVGGSSGGSTGGSASGSTGTTPDIGSDPEDSQIQSSGAIIFTTSIPDMSEAAIANYTGIICIKYGNTLAYSPSEYVFTENFTIPADYTLQIDSGESLTVANGAILTVKGAIVNNGTLTLKKGSTLTGEGSVLATKSDHSFKGWYRDAGLALPFDSFNTPVEQDTTLYPKFEVGASTIEVEIQGVTTVTSSSFLDMPGKQTYSGTPMVYVTDDFGTRFVSLDYEVNYFLLELDGAGEVISRTPITQSVRWAPGTYETVITVIDRENDGFNYQGQLSWRTAVSKCNLSISPKNQIYGVDGSVADNLFSYSPEFYVAQNSIITAIVTEENGTLYTSNAKVVDCNGIDITEYYNFTYSTRTATQATVEEIQASTRFNVVVNSIYVPYEKLIRKEAVSIDVKVNNAYKCLGSDFEISIITEGLKGIYVEGNSLVVTPEFTQNTSDSATAFEKSVSISVTYTNGEFSKTVTQAVTINWEEPTATRIAIYKDGNEITSDSLDITEGATATYTAKVLDQYGYEMSGQTIVWADSELGGVTMENGTLTVDSDVQSQSAMFAIIAGDLSLALPIEIIGKQMQDVTDQITLNISNITYGDEIVLQKAFNGNSEVNPIWTVSYSNDGGVTWKSLDELEINGMLFVGSYKVRVRYEDNSQTGEKIADFTVNKKAVKVMADNKIVCIGGTYVLSYTADGLLDGDTFSAEPTLSTDAAINTAGEYTITVSGATVSDNYEITYENGTLTVREHEYGNWQKHSTDQHTKACECGAAMFTGHSWNEGEITKAPTCTEQGEKTFDCTDCGEIFIGELWIDENAHAWNSGVVTTNPTCSAVGVKTFTCTHNSEHTKTEEVNALGHAYDNVCDTTCNTCGEERTPADHVDEDENNTCDICGSEIPKDGLSGGAIAGIVTGSVVVLGIGGFSLFWFVIKKKKWSDLIGIFKK